jgi:hypothetical protein
MLVVKRADPAYASEVVIWLTRIDNTPTGAALMKRIRTAEPRILICKPDPTEPPNAWTQPEGGGIAGSRQGRPCLVHFDPRDWPHPVDPQRRAADIVLYELLQQAERVQLGFGDPSGAGPSPAMAEDLAHYQAQRTQPTEAAP